jgi:non-ribosomal peptide synthetase component F
MGPVSVESPTHHQSKALLRRVSSYLWCVCRRMGSIPETSVIRGEVLTLPRGREALLHRFFESAARSCASQPALLSENPTDEPLLTFAQLDAAASRLARVIIRHAQTATPTSDGDLIVGVSLAPGAPLIITLLATWKAGAAYMPVEPGIPPQRAAHILADSTPMFVIAEAEVLQAHAPVLIFSELQREASELSDEPIPEEHVLQSELDNTERIAAVLYTSGSTGSPKGVRLPHRAVLNRLRWQWRTFPFTEDEQVCVFKVTIKS